MINFGSAMKEPRCAEIFIEDEIIKIILKKNAAIDIDDALEVIAAFLELREFHPYPVLTDVRTLTTASEEAQRLFMNNFVQERIPASAIMVTRSMQAMANAFVLSAQPKFPARVFVSEKEAMEWLKGYKPKRKEDS